MPRPFFQATGFQIYAKFRGMYMCVVGNKTALGIFDFFFFFVGSEVR